MFGRPVQPALEALEVAEGLQIGVIGRNQGEATTARQMHVQFLFALLHALHAPEPFEVGEAHVGDHAVRGVCDAGEQGNLTLMVGAHLNEGELHVGRHRQQSQRDADVVVEVAFGRVHGVALREDGAQEFLGGRLAVAPGEAKHGATEALPVMVGEVLKGGQHIVDEEEALSFE